MFSNSRNFEVNGGQFNHNVYQTESADTISTTLWPQVAPGAIFDSAERHPPGKCHPGTRNRVINTITAWINDPNPVQRVLWLYGPAGSGKSAIAQSICEKQSASTKYGGSFFFARGHKDCGNGAKLVATLAYQLAQRDPSIHSAISEVVSHDPSLLTKSMEIQFTRLIVLPLLQSQSFPSHSVTLIIDGLDECANDDTQRTIITLIAKSIVEDKLPLRFLIASRPETWIRHAFGTSPSLHITTTFSLRDDTDADKDIKKYLIDGFTNICEDHSQIIQLAPPGWPTMDVIDHFVYEASGQFIYAKTVLKFVGQTGFSNPLEQLRIITSPGPHRALAFSELDTLYSTILAAYPRWETMKLVLGGLLVGLDPTIIEYVFEIDQIELMLVMNGLSSVVYKREKKQLSTPEKHLENIFGPLPTHWFKICHLSFRQFLEDRTRSGRFYIDVLSFRERMATRFLQIISRNIDKGYQEDYTIMLRNSTRVHLTTYCDLMDSLRDCVSSEKSISQITTVTRLFSELAEKLASFNFDRSMKYPGCFLRDLEYIEDVIDYSGASRSDLQDVVDLAQDLANKQLWNSNNLQVTSTYSCINIFTPHHVPIALDYLLKIPGITPADLFSTLAQHRHHIVLDCAKTEWRVRLLYSVVPVINPQMWSQYRNSRARLIQHCLESIMNNDDNDGEHFYIPPFHVKKILVKQFFDGDEHTEPDPFWEMSNCGGNFFHIDQNSALLNFIIRPIGSGWSRLLLRRPEPRLELEFVIGPILRWLNRQLSNPSTLQLIRQHDRFLPQKMWLAMEEIFEKCAVTPNFLATYANEHPVATEVKDPITHPANPSRILAIRSKLEWIKIKVQPLPQAPQQIVSGDQNDRKDYTPDKHCDIFDLHEGLFGNVSDTSIVVPAAHRRTIDRLLTIWRPHLVSHLLGSLVQCYYNLTTQAELAKGLRSRERFTRRHIVENLPYAETSQQNLDALRAVVYYSGQPMSCPWHPPIHFCSSAREFLRKYERSMLSFEELELFERSLSDLRHLEANNSESE